MYPYEISFDNDGIGYIDLKKKKFPLFEMSFNEDKFYPKTNFYPLPSTGNYILKVNKNHSINDKALYEMIKRLLILQSKNPNIDFPIGYVKNGNDVIGQIIVYYEKAKSLRNIYNYEDLVSLQKYFYRDEDTIHNLFLVYDEVLDKLENLLDNGVLYLDIHAGNFVFYNNEVKVIDFDPKYINFDERMYFKNNLINNYINMVNNVNYEFGLDLGITEFFDNLSFKEVKQKIIKLENNIRKNYR